MTALALLAARTASHTFACERSVADTSMYNVE